MLGGLASADEPVNTDIFRLSVRELVPDLRLAVRLRNCGGLRRRAIRRTLRIGNGGSFLIRIRSDQVSVAQRRGKVAAQSCDLGGRRRGGVSLRAAIRAGQSGGWQKRNER